jgi:predicted DNA binding CopG/RHH family protein
MYALGRDAPRLLRDPADGLRSAAVVGWRPVELLEFGAYGVDVGGHDMTDRTARARRDAIRAEYAAEEAEAAETEAVEAEQAVLSVRVPAHLAEALKARAAAEHIPASALIRRILVTGVEPGPAALTVEQVEEIARRVVLEDTSR